MLTRQQAKPLLERFADHLGYSPQLIYDFYRVASIDMFGFQLASVVSTLATGLVVDAIGAENVRQVVLGMVAISAVPLVIWVLIVPRLERREQLLTVPAGD